MTDTAKIKSDLLTAVKAEIPEAVEQEAKLYSRIMLGKKTLAYLFDAKDGLKVDLYIEASALPKNVAKAFAPGRGRARKEGLIAVLSGKKAEQNAVVAALKVAAAALTTPEAPAPNGGGDEFATDLKEAAKGADESSRKTTARRGAKATA